MEREVVIVTHLPKTGGVSFTNILKEVYGKNQVQIFPNHSIDGPVFDHSKVVIGHLPYGCHKDINPEREYTYLTFLRDPVRRVVSNFRYLQRQGNGPSSLPEFLDTGTALVDNLQVRMLIDKNWSDWDTRVDPLDEKDLRQAKFNLSQYYPLIGVTERFNTSLTRIALHLDWNILPAPRFDNVSPGPEATPMPGTRQRIEKMNRFDIQLYEWALDFYDYR